MKEAPVECEKESLLIIRVVSKVLDQLIAGAKIPSHNLGLFIKFQSSYAPEVSVQSYLERIRKYSRCSDACFVMALIYIDRLIECRQLMLSQLNVHRLLITSVMLAAKYHDDLFYNNSYYAKLGGLPLTELNMLEVDFLKLMSFSLFINNDAYGKYYNELKNYLFCVDIVPSPVSVVASNTPPNSGRLSASNSCPNLSNVVASNSVCRVPSPHNPHDKAVSVNVSNEYYFGGYAAYVAASSNVIESCASADSPEFFDGNNLIDYASPVRFGNGTLFGTDHSEKSEPFYPFAQFGHQHSCDSVANIPYYLSPTLHQVRQSDHQVSSWRNSAALMTNEEPRSVRSNQLSLNPAEFNVPSTYHHHLYYDGESTAGSHSRPANENNQFLRCDSQLNNNRSWYGGSSTSQTYHYQNQQLYDECHQVSEHVDMPNVVDIHGTFHGAYATGYPSYNRNQLGVSVGGENCNMKQAFRQNSNQNNRLYY